MPVALDGDGRPVAWGDQVVGQDIPDPPDPAPEYRWDGDVWVHEPRPEHSAVMEQIEGAERRFGAYWVYQRLLGNTPAEMPDPLRNRPSVPARDPNGTTTEQAVDSWMTEYENENSL